MQIARSALETEGATVAELADRLGYKSEAAFARAFKRVSGIPPGAVKRRGETRTGTSGGLAPAMAAS
jgi:AraC-like DNA-binding protein